MKTKFLIIIGIVVFFNIPLMNAFAENTSIEICNWKKEARVCAEMIRDWKEQAYYHKNMASGWKKQAHFCLKQINEYSRDSDKELRAWTKKVHAWENEVRYWKKLATKYKKEAFQ